ncbi:MAG: hypothetical protein AAF213_09185 [Pseudomonadota bacterium]
MTAHDAPHNSPNTAPKEPAQDPMSGDELRARRGLLRSVSSPATGHDYLIDLHIVLRLASRPDALDLRLRYVPDRDLVDNDQLGAYWQYVEGYAWPTLASLALSVLEDMNNEVIPRWLQVQVRDSALNERCQDQMITVEDRQPGWHNQHLLGRIGRVEF